MSRDWGDETVVGGVAAQPPAAPFSAPAAPPGPRVILLDLARLCRPKQWAKNVFVLAPLLFSGALFDPRQWLLAGVALGCFCLLSSAVYCLNDALDAPTDRRHPRKRNRPVASGRVSAGAALALGALLVLTAAAVAWQALPKSFLLLGAAYLVNNVLYCWFLKHRAIVDVLCIAIGFVIRIIAGCVAIGVAPSSWVLVCGFSLALLLGFGKRRLEVAALANGAEFRPVLISYSAEKVNLLLGITSSMCLLSYMLYTVSPQTIALHKTDQLVYSVPFVAYGVFRYLLKVQEGKHDGPVEVLLKDPVFFLNGLLWVGSIVAILYLPGYLGL